MLLICKEALVSPTKPRKRGVWAASSRAVLTRLGWSLVVVSSVLLSPPVRGQTEVSRSPEAGSPAIVEPAWIRLFNDVDLAGWAPATSANWAVADGAIVVDAGEPGLLRTTSQFSEFELELEFLANPDSNSGVFLLTSPRPTDPARDCVEVNIIRPDRHRFSTGSLVARAVGESPAHPDGERWLRMRAEVRDGQIRTWIEGQLVVDYREPQRLGRGYIGLQYNGGRAAFRQIRLRPLGLQELIPAVDDPAEALAEWNAEQIGTARADWDPAARILNLAGGPGQLESRRQWGDFVLQCECRTNAAEVNSGIFFRSIPGQFQMGYELQIDHRKLPGPSGRPLESGTGSVFRQTVANRVPAADGEWFWMTAVVCGPHVSVWVNGEQVTDWSDRRKPDPNPRRGLRLEPGNLILQAHDPGTNLSFRRIAVSELLPRNVPPAEAGTPARTPE